MDPRPFHFDYRQPPSNISPTYFSDRLYSYLQPQQQSLIGSSRYLKKASRQSKSRLSSPASSLNYGYFNNNQKFQHDQDLNNNNQHQNREYGKNKILYFRKNLQHQLNTYGYKKDDKKEQKRAQSMDSLISITKSSNMDSRQHEETKSNKVIDQYHDNYNKYRMKLLPKSRYDPVIGGQFIDNKKVLQKLINNSALSNYSNDALQDQVEQIQRDKVIGVMGHTSTAPSAIRDQNVTESSKDMMGDLYKKYILNHRYIQQKNQRQYNIINGNGINPENQTTKSRQNGSSDNRSRKSGISSISGFSSMKTKYLPMAMGKRQGFRRLGVKK